MSEEPDKTQVVHSPQSSPLLDFQDGQAFDLSQGPLHSENNTQQRAENFKESGQNTQLSNAGDNDTQQRAENFEESGQDTQLPNAANDTQHPDAVDATQQQLGTPQARPKKRKLDTNQGGRIGPPAFSTNDAQTHITVEVQTGETSETRAEAKLLLTNQGINVGRLEIKATKQPHQIGFNPQVVKTSHRASCVSRQQLEIRRDANGNPMVRNVSSGTTSQVFVVQELKASQQTTLSAGTTVYVVPLNDKVNDKAPVIVRNP